VLVGYDFDDSVDGGAGNDTVTGGPGRDTIYGDATSSHCSWYSCKIPFGNDVIQARDGEVDNIDCGIGTDQAVVDTIDIVANCENVGAAAPPPADAGLALTVKRTSLRALAKKGLTVTVPCPSACKVSGALLLGGKKVGGGRAKGSGTVSVKLKLDRKAKRRVKRMRKATVTVRVTVGAQTASKTLKLKR
jgi:Ca2+-binding RTX toxin-like protein